MTEAKKMLINWLNDAYGLETQLIEVLEAHRDQADGYPDVQAKIKEHLGRTKEHADRVGKCIREFGEEPSATKEMVGSMKGELSGVKSGMAHDRIVRNAIADFAAEHKEIALYTAISIAATELEHPQVADMCDEILTDEQEMADWLETNLPVAVRTHLEEMRSKDM